MVKRLHWAVLRTLPGPFFAAFGTLMFLLLMQFLMRYLPELVGKGLPLVAIGELVAYSLAYMVTLAAPMAWLIALLVAFGRLAESRAYAVVKSAGISLPRLVWPVFVVAVGLVAGMAYFNNVLLPEANFRLAGLWSDIRLKRPGFDLEPGVFYTGLGGHALRAEVIPPDSSGLLVGVTLFQTDTPGGAAVLVAKRARLQPRGTHLFVMLEDGELHRRAAGGRREGGNRYERLAFARHRLVFDLSDLLFARRERSDESRSDRTMRTSAMIAIVDSLERGVERRFAEARASLTRLGRPTDSLSAVARTPAQPAPVDTTAYRHPLLNGLDVDERRAAFDLALQRARAVRGDLDAAASAAEWELQRADRYRVEIYKKNSIALACLVFVLVGVPLGLAIARGGVGLISTLAVAVFLFYWVSLVQGEKLADRGMLPPWLGMWAANVIVGLLGLWLFWREARSPAGRDPLGALASRFKARGG